MMLKPVETRRVSDEVAHQLRTLIFSREFAAGTRLPTERILSKRLRVHRSSLREALKRLEVEGLVEIRRGDGLYVRDFMKEANLAALESFLFAPQSRQLEIFRCIQEFRLHFQCEMGRLAALRRTDADLAAIDEVVAAEGKCRDPQEFRTLDWAFAQAVARATQNVIYTLCLNSVREMHERWGGIYFSAPDTIEKTRRFHRLIARAIRARRDARAASVVRRLLEYSNPILLEGLAKFLVPADSEALPTNSVPLRTVKEEASP
jgi:GntR family transcriptional repressor for pyruvate dehydrogenase complex